MKKPPPEPVAELTAPMPGEAGEPAQPRAEEPGTGPAAVSSPVERGGRGHVTVPIRLRLRAQDLATELERAIEALADRLGRALARSAEVLHESHPGAVPMPSAPSFTWVGADVARVPAAMRQAVEQRIAEVIAAAAAQRLTPARVSTSRPEGMETGSALQRRGAVSGRRREVAARPAVLYRGSRMAGHHAPALPASRSAAASGLLSFPAPGTAAGLPSIQQAGEPVNRIGIVNWDGTPAVRLRSSPDTESDNVIGELSFNTRVHVIRRLPGGWYYVATPSGQIGHVASSYVWTNLPEPGARLHRVQGGRAGYAISIAEHFYGAHADDWGQDLRFYVGVLAWANRMPVPRERGDWRNVHFQPGHLIWIPSVEFARSLRGLVHSGSLSYDIAESLGVAELMERVGQLWDDIARAIELSGKYMGEAIARHVEEALWRALEALVIFLVGAGLFLAFTTALGAAIGALAGGVGAAPGAAIGFEVGLALIEWFGLGMLLYWIGDALGRVGGAFAVFLGLVWDARGNQATLDRAARALAEAVGVFLATLLEAVVMFAAAKGIGAAVGALRGTRLGQAIGESHLGRWLSQRLQNVSQGRSKVPTPRNAMRRLRGRTQQQGEGTQGTTETGPKKPEAAETTRPESAEVTPEKPATQTTEATPEKPVTQTTEATPEKPATQTTEATPEKPAVEAQAVVEPPRTLDALAARLSPRAREGLQQQKVLLSPERFQQMENAYRNPDGTYDIARANKIFESKWLDEAAYQARRASVEAELLAKINENIETIKNLVAETDGTRRLGATLGDRTSETALLWEIVNGKPYKSPQGHYLKIRNAIVTIQEAIAVLRSHRPKLTGEQAAIDAAIQSGSDRVNSMRPALDLWNRRAVDHPGVWNPDGTSRVHPGWPADPGPQ